MRDAEEFNSHLVDECLDFGPEWYDGRAVDLIRARDAEVRAATLAEFTEWFAPAYTAPNGNTCPIGPETVAREFAVSDARDMASPEDETPVYVARRLVGRWEPEP